MRFNLSTSARSALVLFFFVFSTGLTSLPANAVPIGTTYTATLTDLFGGLELAGGDVFAAEITSTVIKTAEDRWDYLYNLAVFAISDVVRIWIQADPGLTTANFFDVSPPAWLLDSHDLGYAQNAFGMLFTDLSCTVCNISFTATAEPVFGSFSFDTMGGGVGYNENFGGIAVSPNAFLGTLSDGFLYVPGPKVISEPTPVPAPGTLGLVLAGVGIFAGALRRR